MKIPTSAPITVAVLALTVACASSKVQPTAGPQQASTATASAPGGIPKSVLERYVGEYQLTPQVTAVIRLEGNTLIRDIMGQKQTLTPISETRFRLGGGVVEFEVDKSGAVTMITGGGGRVPRKGKV